MKIRGQKLHSASQFAMFGWVFVPLSPGPHAVFFQILQAASFDVGRIFLSASVILFKTSVISASATMRRTTIVITTLIDFSKPFFAIISNMRRSHIYS